MGGDRVEQFDTLMSFITEKQTDESLSSEYMAEVCNVVADILKKDKGTIVIKEIEDVKELLSINLIEEQNISNSPSDILDENKHKKGGDTKNLHQFKVAHITRNR